MANGWNKSLVHRWFMNLDVMRDELKKPPTPIGARDGGTLRKSFILSRERGISSIKDAAGKPIGIRIINETPYARIRDIGGRIPDRRPVRARWMRWIDKSGEVIFAKFARGYDVPALNYVRAAVNRFLFNSKNITIQWD